MAVFTALGALALTFASPVASRAAQVLRARKANGEHDPYAEVTVGYP